MALGMSRSRPADHRFVLAIYKGSGGKMDAAIPTVARAQWQIMFRVLSFILSSRLVCRLETCIFSNINLTVMLV